MFNRKRQRAPFFGGITADDDRDIEIQRLESTKRRHFWSEAGLLARDLFIAGMLTLLIGVFIVQPVKVEGFSMMPYLHDGERIIVNKLIYYDLPALERGDIVVFWFPDDPSKSYIKRVIGLPGETVEVRDGRVLVNGQELNEPYLDPSLSQSRANHPPVIVRSNYFFVMGDNRDHSSDSRYWGLVPRKYIYGKALLRFWPLDRIGWIAHQDYAGTTPVSRNAAPARQSDRQDAREPEEN